MRFLADECCDFGLVRALRETGHDVQAVADISPRAEDPVVIALAAMEDRILLTEDKDFGQLVYAAGAPSSAGVILLRYPVTARQAVKKTLLELIQQKGDQLAGRFAVVRPGRVRISAVPDSGIDS